MSDQWKCHICGERANISDRFGPWCKAHWDEMRSKKQAEWKQLTIDAGGPWPQHCPRRGEGGVASAFPGPDTWDIREQMNNGAVARMCSYCGSLHPDDLITMLGEGYSLHGTDKGYKFYVDGPTDKMVAKFYTAHLTDEHRKVLREMGR